MKITFLTLFIALAFHTMGTQAAWNKNRILYVFDQDRNTKSVKHQLELLSEQTEGCKERHMEIIVVSESPKRGLLQRKYSYTGDAFMIILVGKDGSEKYRSQSPVKPEELFAIIDAMPMRKYEIRLNR